VLTTIMNDSKVAAAARVAAATAVLDRGWGRPQQPINANLSVVPPEVQKQREEARQRAFAILKQMERGRFLDLSPSALEPPTNGPD
jgi:hypothetical protein